MKRFAKRKCTNSLDTASILSGVTFYFWLSVTFTTVPVISSLSGIIFLRYCDWTLLENMFAFS